MREIVVISGKGGTGKTSITASFAILAGKKAVIADCDVDAADLHLLLKPDFSKSEDFFSGYLAKIDATECIHCGTCMLVCRFDAIKANEYYYSIDPADCEGCGYCSQICPQRAISMINRLSGKFYLSRTKTGSFMAHARLFPGAENSGKLVAKVKKEARRIAEENNKEIILIDGSPGIGCPVISSLAGASFVVFVTEPTISGLHDLGRIHSLTQKFGIEAGCIINKYDINPELSQKIESFLIKNNIKIISKIPYDNTFTKAMIEGKTIVEYDSKKYSQLLTDSWETILDAVNKKSVFEN